MKTLALCLIAGALALTTVAAMESTIAGTWEGSIDGRKTVTLRVLEKDGKLSGEAVFYILKAKDTGRYLDETPPAVPLSNLQWDGRTLRLSVEPPGGDTVRFELVVAVAGAAVLKRLGDGATVPMEKLKPRPPAAIR